jgi:hypothetical protein
MVHEQAIEQRMHKGGENQGAHQYMDPEHTAHAEIGSKLPGLARVHQICLHPTLEPACPLPKPLAEIDGRLFPSGRRQYLGAPPAARHAEAEIGILGHVEWIPPAAAN